MGALFSLQGLIATGVVVLCLIILHLLFKIGPHFAPLFKLLATLLVPLLLAMIVAYLLHPLVRMLMRFKLNRTSAILFLFLIFFGLIMTGCWLIFPLLMEQVRALIAQLPAVQEQLLAWYDRFDHQLDRLPRGLHETIDDLLNNFEENIRRWLEETFHKLSSWLSHLFILLVVPFFAFYLLKDLEGIQKRLFWLIPRRHRKMVYRLWRDIDQSLGQYIRGQLLVSLLVGCLAVAGYYLIGLPYALFLGSLVGLFNVIPYFGPIIGTVLSGLIALLFGQPRLIIWVLLINIGIQITEGNVINPYVVGKRLKIHPIVVILTLLVGAEVGGIIGLLFAVPLFVIIRVIVVSTLMHLQSYRAVRELKDV